MEHLDPKFTVKHSHRKQSQDRTLILYFMGFCIHKMQICQLHDVGRKINKFNSYSLVIAIFQVGFLPADLQ